MIGFVWAVVSQNNIRDVVGYLTFAKKDLYDFDPKVPKSPFATSCPIHLFVNYLKMMTMNKPTDLDGAVGEGLAVKFMAQSKVAAIYVNPNRYNGW